ncbi:MAG: GyrI-like domain-containing protein [Pirellulales bacterium]
MRVLVIVKATKSSEAGELPSTELLAAMGQYNEQLVQAGIMVEGAGLTPSSRGARVRFSGESRTVIDGPFAETKELIAGYWVWKVGSLAEAIEWVKKCPNPMPEESEIEIRPFYEFEDFGEAYTPELRERAAVTHAQAVGLPAPTFRQGPALVLSGLNATYDMTTRVGIPAHWGRFVPRVIALTQGQLGDSYGVCWNTDDACRFDYLTAVELPASVTVPEDFVTLKIPARRYAVFVHEGHVSAIPQTIDTIWTKWAPQCELKIAKAPCFERYTPEFNGATGMGGMEFWIPLD